MRDCTPNLKNREKDRHSPVKSQLNLSSLRKKRGLKRQIKHTGQSPNFRMPTWKKIKSTKIQVVWTTNDVEGKQVIWPPCILFSPLIKGNFKFLPVHKVLWDLELEGKDLSTWSRKGNAVFWNITSTQLVGVYPSHCSPDELSKKTVCCYNLLGLQ